MSTELKNICEAFENLKNAFETLNKLLAKIEPTEEQKRKELAKEIFDLSYSDNRYNYMTLEDFATDLYKVSPEDYCSLKRIIFDEHTDQQIRSLSLELVFAFKKMTFQRSADNTK